MAYMFLLKVGDGVGSLWPFSLLSWLCLVQDAEVDPLLHCQLTDIKPVSTLQLAFFVHRRIVLEQRFQSTGEMSEAEARLSNGRANAEKQKTTKKKKTA